MRWPWQRREQRANGSGSGYTAQIIAERAAYIAGRRGLAELTGTAQGCIALWENSFALARVTGADLLTPRVLALIGRALALRGEAVFYLANGGSMLVPAADWEVATRNSVPTAYRLSLPDTGGGQTIVALALEVLHFVTGSDMATPYAGSAPLRRAQLSAALLHALEAALCEVYENAPLGSQIVPFPENPAVDNDALSRGFRARRGAILLRESVNVTAGGGPTPQTDWRPSSLSPDLERAATTATLAAAREAIVSAFGLLPALFDPKTAAPLVREAQRHLVQFTLQPIAALVAQEASEKLGAAVAVDLVSPLQAFDQGGRSRALLGMVEAMARAKEAGLTPEQLKFALAFIDEEKTAP